MNLLFDLDGTLTDPAEGIIKCIQFALEKLEVDVPEAKELEWCIGPPLQESFFKLLPEDKQDQADQALRLYRERFSIKGMFENSPYPGIEDVLNDLKNKDFSLFVATSKPHVFAKEILEHFKLSQYFIKIFGSELDGRNRQKTELIRYIVNDEKLVKDNTLMIGDREHDLIGANNCNIRSIGVTYGYGSYDELKACGPIKIIDSPLELRSYLIKWNHG